MKRSRASCTIGGGFDTELRHGSYLLLDDLYPYFNQNIAEWRPLVPVSPQDLDAGLGSALRLPFWRLSKPVVCVEYSMIRDRALPTSVRTRSSWRSLGMTVVLATASVTALLVVVEKQTGGTAALQAPPAEHASARTHADAATVLYDRAIVDPAPSMRPERLDFAHNRPLETTFSPWPDRREARLRLPLPPVRQQTDEAPQDTPAAKIAQSLPIFAPLPAPRPPAFRDPKSEEPTSPAKVPAARVVASADAASASAESPSLIEKLFGAKSPSAPSAALGYAPRDVVASTAPDMRVKPEPNADGTATYDISAKVVYMPNGEKLEAHSGLGELLDDPRHVHVRMRGATPPGTYTLTERERLFHGVRAIRMTPVGGSAAIHGRDGILAHTYMLGPKGDSNGCISFKNYDRFLQAYLKGEVKRLVVVAGSGHNSLPRVVDSRFSADQRS
jgi:hypothetical protein